MFYTYYKQWGNNILFSYIDDDDITHHKKIRDYKPTLYIKTDEESDLKSIYGYTVKPVELESIKEAKEFLKTYKDVDGMEIDGNTKFANQFTIELFEGQRPEHNPNLIRGALIDIEVSAPEFPYPIYAKYAVDLITLYDTRDKLYYVYSLYDFNIALAPDDVKSIKDKIVFKKFNNERELLTAFVERFQTTKYNFASGWNSSGFDMPYLVNRIEQILGKSMLNKLSPFGIVNKSEVTDDYMNKTLKVDIVGLPDIDYMLLYKKHILKPRENYRLETICNVELGTGKLDYTEAGSLYNLSKTNPQKFVSYNIIDVERLVRLEEKLQLFQITYVLAYHAFCNYDDTLGTVGMWECYMANELYKRGMITPSYNSNKSFSPYPGGYVKEPQVGRHKWVISFDLNSLYPHIEMQCNISPETLIPQKDLPEELLELQYKLMVKDPLTYYNECKDLVDKKVDLSLLKKYNVSMSACGNFYTKEYKGIIPIVNEELYSNRKKVKGEMLNNEQLLADVKYELKRRGI